LERWLWWRKRGAERNEIRTHAAEGFYVLQASKNKNRQVTLYKRKPQKSIARGEESCLSLRLSQRIKGVFPRTASPLPGERDTWYLRGENQKTGRPTYLTGRVGRYAIAYHFCLFTSELFYLSKAEDDLACPSILPFLSFSSFSFQTHGPRCMYLYLLGLFVSCESTSVVGRNEKAQQVLPIFPIFWRVRLNMHGCLICLRL